MQKKPTNQFFLEKIGGKNLFSFENVRKMQNRIFAIFKCSRV